MQPQLSDYTAAASAIYDPLQSGDLASAAADHQSAIDGLESQKGTVAQNYNNSIYDLNNQTAQSTAKINQQYTLALGGNFSGLQGNDLGMLYSSANHDAANIALTRDNALNTISGQENDENTNYTANVGAIQGKYASQKAQYAQSAYASALDSYQKNIQQQQQFALDQARLNETVRHDQVDEANSGSTAAAANAKLYQATAKKSGGFSYTGPNGQALNLGQYAKSVSSTPQEALSVIRNQLQSSNTSTDKAALAYFNAQVQKYGGNFNQVVGALSNKKDFASLFNGM